MSSKIYSNWDFWYENITSGNPVWYAISWYVGSYPLENITVCAMYITCRYVCNVLKTISVGQKRLFFSSISKLTMQIANVSRKINIFV
jgi:hypothetical protein